MNTDGVIGRLEEIFSKDETAIILSSLRQNNFIWNKIHDKEFLEGLYSTFKNNFTDWNPANIALYSLDKDIVTPSGNIPRINVKPQTATEANKKLSEYSELSGSINNLKDATLMAIGIREKYFKTKSFDSVLDLIFNDDNGELWTRWDSVLEILYGLLDDPFEMLMSFLSRSNNSNHLNLLVRIILSNPLSENEHQNIFQRLIENLNFQEKIIFIKEIFKYGKKNIGINLSKHIIRMSESFEDQSEKLKNQNIKNDFYNMVDLNQLAELYKYSGNFEKSQLLHNNAATKLHELVKELDLELDDAREEFLYQDAVQNQLCEKFIDSSNYKRVENGQDDFNITNTQNALLLNKDYHTVINYALNVFDKNKQEDAKQIGRYIFEKIIDELITKGSISQRINRNYIYSNQFIKDLRRLGLYNEALELALFLVDKYPTDTGILLEISTLLELLGDDTNSINYVKLINHLEPNNVEYLRRLAILWDKVENYENSLENWIRVNEVNKEPDGNDLLMLARSCINNNQYDQAIEICKDIIEIDRENGEAYKLIALALMNTNDWGEVFENLQNATKYAPQDSEAWLLLSNAFNLSNHKSKSLETLFQANNINPASTDITLQLIVDLLNNGKLSEGIKLFDSISKLELKHLKKIFELIQIFQDLGLIDEVGNLFDLVLNKWPDNNELIQENAKFLLKQNKYGKYSNLNRVIARADNLDNDFIDEYINLLVSSRDLLTINNKVSSLDLKNAELLLDKIIRENNTSVVPQLLLAEVLNASNKIDLSNTICQELKNNNEIKSKGLNWRLNLISSLNAYKLGDIDSARSFAKNAYNENHDEISVLKMYAGTLDNEKYLYEKIQILENIQELAGNDSEDLIFVGNNLYLSGEIEEAKNVLENIVDNDKNNSEALSLLAEQLVKSGDGEEAEKRIKQLLAINNLDQKYYIKAANLYDLLNRSKESLACLKKAAGIVEEKNNNLFIRLSKKYLEMGDPSNALNNINKIDDSKNSFPELFDLKTKIFVSLGKPSEALFQSQKRFAQIDRDNKLNNRLFGNELRFDINDVWNGSNDQDKVKDLMNQIDLLISIGNIKSAINKLKDNKNIIEKSPVLERLTIFLSKNILGESWYNNFSSKRVEEIETIITNPDYSTDKDLEKVYITYLEKYIDEAIQKGNKIEAIRLVEKVLKFSDEDPVQKVYQARLVAHQGNILLAKEIFNQAQDLRNSKQKSIGFSENDLRVEKRIESKIESYESYIYSKAALDCMSWDEAYIYADTFVKNNPHEILPYLNLANVIINTKEMQLLFGELDCVANCPSSKFINSNSYKEFESAIKKAKLFNNHQYINILSTRGKLGFGITKNKAEKYIGYKDIYENARWITASLRRGGKNEEMLDMIAKYKNDPYVYVNYIISDTSKNLDLNNDDFKNHLNRTNNNPLLLAAFSRAFEEIDPQLAQKSIQSALSMWPDEHKWHAQAARLANQNGEDQVCLDHWNKAISLKPDDEHYLENLSYAIYQDGQQ